MKELIRAMVEIPGPSGYETRIRQAILAQIQPHVDETRVDALGNLIALKSAQNAAGRKIMLVAHMDEIGLIATHIEESGYIRFIAIGGVRPLFSVGGRVRFLDGLPGVIGHERQSEASRVPPVDRLFIDIGAHDRKSCPVKVGDVAVFERPFHELGKRLVSKAMDDRVGVAVLVETIHQLSKTPHQLIFVFSAQEEVGLRGATAAAFGVDPDLGLAVDVTATGDTPNGLKMDVSLGKGPAIKIRDEGMLADPAVVDWMVKAAKKAKIPYQLEILESGLTDAAAIQLTHAGVPSGCLSIPCRYIHSQSEMVDFADVQNAVHLLLELLSNPVRV